MSGLGAKRAFDVAVAALALIALSPLLLVLAAAVRVRIGSPIFFVQARPGLAGRPFRLIKFRTMRDARDPVGVPLPDAQRLTPFGRWLRASSLDELPELWNVLVGDMSLVGPRPLLMQYLPLYSREQARRHDLRPGLTGWAQINGRNAIGWPEKLALDVWYVDNRTMALDIRIVFATAWKVVLRRGVNADDHATMPEFMGGAAAPNADEAR